MTDLLEIGKRFGSDMFDVHPKSWTKNLTFGVQYSSIPLFHYNLLLPPVHLRILLFNEVFCDDCF